MPAGPEGPTYLQSCRGGIKRALYVQAGPSGQFRLMADLDQLDAAQIRRVFIMIFALSFYHAFTSIAQHFHWNNLVWPKEILSSEVGFAPKGLSRGVFLQPGVFGIYLGMTLMVQFYFLIRARKLWLEVLDSDGEPRLREL